MQYQPLWIPTAERIAKSRMSAFIGFARRQEADLPEDYEALHQWSVANKEKFWQLIWDYFKVIGQDSPTILENPTAMPGAKWFPSAKLNFAENLLKFGSDSTFSDIPAIIAYAETGEKHTLSWQQLQQRVAALAAFFRARGIQKGDRIAAFMPNCADNVVAMLAATSLGAVWSSCSPDFGLQGVIDRFGQIEPKILLATNGYHYNGKVVDTRARVASIKDSIDSLEILIWHDYIADFEVELTAESTLPQLLLKDLYSHSAALSFTPCNFNDPLYIMYSSGTTGVPKCIVHGIGGTLLQHLKELGLHTDLKPKDRIFYFTTCGWMMWNWLVSSLALGGTLILYDGSPFAPTPDVLFNIAEKENIRIFGAGAKYYSACEKAQVKPIASHNLQSLETLLSTGSPLAHESFDYLYRDVKADICVSSISGGTDIISCFALGNPTLPVYRGELQCIGLGLEVSFCDSEGKDLLGDKGELICRSPFPSMPIGFWNDPDQAKFHGAYFDTYPNIWAHGDYGEIVDHQAHGELPAQRGIIIHGRSDAVLNPGGVRIGTAEIYRQVEKIEEVIEAIAIGQRQGDDERVVLFVKLRPGISLDEALVSRIKTTIKANTTPRHVPAIVLAVADIPRTISGKIVELAVKNVVHGIPVKNKDALANPEALDNFAGLKELES
jgi:acetoacetyl-CoA synthetase